MKKPWAPHDYQIKSCNDLLTNRNWALFLDPGLGKTSVVLRALKHIKETVGYKKTLIVGPLRVITEVWPNEIEEWEDFSGLKCEVFHGRDPLDIIDSTADIILVNFDYLKKMHKACVDNLGSSTFTKFTNQLASFYHLNGLVLDELTAFKNTGSHRYKIVFHNVDGFEYRWGLTASPVANRLTDIFGQAYVIDAGAQFGKYVTHFRNKYFVPDGFNWRIRDVEAKEMIYSKIDKIGTRLSAADYLKLPAFSTNNISIELDSKVSKIYKSMEELFVAELNDNVAIAPTKAISMLKCQQITGGLVYNEGGVEHIHDHKYDALKNLTDELNGEPLLTFINFKSEADLLKSRFGKECEVINGGTNGRDTKRILEQWNAGDLPLLVTHPKATGHGLNLQHGGHNICWYTLTYDYELYDQANCRVFRQGQKNNVMCHKLLCKGTIDWYINKVLSKKGMAQNELFSYMKELMNGGK